MNPEDFVVVDGTPPDERFDGDVTLSGELTGSSTISDWPFAESASADYLNDIEEIVGEKIIDGKLYYEVKWKQTIEKCSQILKDAPSIVENFDLYKRIGRHITITTCRWNRSNDDELTTDDISQVLYQISYKDTTTFVTHKFLELYYPRELIQFMIPQLCEGR